MRASRGATTRRGSAKRRAAKKEMSTAATKGISRFLGKAVSVATGSRCSPSLRVVSNRLLTSSRPTELSAAASASPALGAEPRCVLPDDSRGANISFAVTRGLIHGIPARVES